MRGLVGGVARGTIYQAADLATSTPADLRAIEHRIKTVPRRSLHWSTANDLHCRRDGRLNSPRTPTMVTEQPERADRPAAHGPSAPTRRHEIMTAGLKLMADKGIAQTGMRDIGRAAGILGGSLYHHFSSKDEIIDIALRQAAWQLSDDYSDAVNSRSDPLVRLELLIRISFDFIANWPDHTRVYLAERNYLQASPLFAWIKPLEVNHRVMWRDAVRDAIRSGALREDIHPVHMSAFLRDAIWNLSRWSSGRQDPEKLDRARDEFITLVFYGCVVR